MYLGRIVEVGPVEEVLLALGIPTRRRSSPPFPTTRGAPLARPLAGEPPDPTAIPPAAASIRAVPGGPRCRTATPRRSCA